MHRILASAIAATLSLPAIATAADDAALTIYRSDGGALFEGGGSPVADGYAVVHEVRVLTLDGGRQTVVIDGLPSTIDAEAIAIDSVRGTRVLAQRVLAAGDTGLLAAHRGEAIEVFAADRLLVGGTLLSIDGNGIGVRAGDGRVHYVRDYTSVRFASGSGQPGSTLQLALEGKAGSERVRLAYPTSGLGWRAAYSVVLADADACAMRFEALASIANRSGRDYPASRLKLIAGTANFAKPSMAQPMMMAKGMVAEAAPFDLPEQTSLGDYRSFAIDGTLDLPDASVTQVPLYAARELPCQRSWLFESGNTWYPPKPMTGATGTTRSSGPVLGTLRFSAAENLPAGYLRVLMRDRDGQLEFLGENRVGDTPKGQPVDLTLGNAFELSATRERTAFTVDRGARTMGEGFRLGFSNAGASARTVTVREHPNRWTQWKLATSSAKPTRQTPDTLEFEINVPANGKAVLDYSVAYTWTPADD
ncbi:hypothetical protein [Dokdonella sp.]|uniref:DUF4139 domain-containing protein n=1 Tax=Dokdonella sp. TaxID=2291710 RepID=UPI0025C4D09F|nr:hypothetical protein [Dokdonella sp.]MBX3692119.1 hypothetical protein [Dokdonella sp.]MCW5567986.1 hypothetical protein [Dokdonella sp.]